MDFHSEKHHDGAKPQGSDPADSESISGRPGQSLKRYARPIIVKRMPDEHLLSGCQTNETTVRTYRFMDARRGQPIYPRVTSHIAMISIGGPSFKLVPSFQLRNRRSNRV